ncbi:phospholipase A2 inhibitor and Ly6/PLAUR domain-containing protein-like isoform X6 [Thunnus albacares]|uniref:phospholipase A2 inhibitor and Ly6/PLAUR domain-containing protein-like isoform X6 n=1 Tax=Thunnus albacares TaxID=8236 RepID=UPI001CF71199|nr:phospholipase A2 inhibitor and Ly6/PLAUR domain-containing protein-like isoform X6 [Thunnus albacares]
MMKLILSLTLIWTLSSTAEAVKCWTGDGADIKQQSCDSDELCATVAYQGSLLGTFTQDATRLCLPSLFISEGKHTYSFNVGFASMAASVHVCNTDHCNSQAIPYPDLKKNNLQCFTCYYPSSAVCDMTVQCVGMEDRCISGTGESS